jgi:ribose/xylose/arabinose/galactoside ABC-type transport system permease subunit
VAGSQTAPAVLVVAVIARFVLRGTGVGRYVYAVPSSNPQIIR